MSRRWRVRVAVALAAWAVAVGAMSAMQMRPNALVIGAIVAAVASIGWLMLDLSDVSEPVDWRATREGTGTGRGADARVRAIQRQLTSGRVLGSDEMIHASLVRVVDGLLVERGIDRAAEPGRAAAALGPDLAGFVAAVPPPGRWAEPGFLPSTLSRIEALRTETIP